MALSKEINMLGSLFSQNNKTRQPHSGWGILEQGGIGLVIVLVIIFVVALVAGLWSKKDVAIEVSNYQSITSSARGYLKSTTAGYNFASGASMTGTLISVGGARGMQTQGDPSSGTATLLNSFGGQVILTPLMSNGFNSGFRLSTAKIPQEACIAIAQQLGSSGAYSSIAINGSEHSDGRVNAETAAKECTKNVGSTGQNTMIFTVSN